MKKPRMTGMRRGRPTSWLACAAAAMVVLAGLGPARADPYEVPDAELMTTDFGLIPGFSGSSSTLDSKNDVPGPGVQFLVTLAGPDSGKMGIGDPWPTDPAAAFGWDPVLSHWTSLAAYDSYEMTIKYVSGPSGDVDIAVFLNTGLTGPSGNPSNDWTNDTFWGGPWTNLALGQTTTLTLDFGAAEAWNISDNKVPHTGGGQGWAGGGIYAINQRDRNEISNIGLQIADFDGDVLDKGQVTLHLNVPEPASLTLLLVGVVTAVGFRRRKRG